MTVEPTQRRPVMADVARLAGVSHQTVSRVINGSASIRPSTRERVERAIADLGYHPNTAARALVTRRSKIIGIIGSNTALYGPASIQFSIQDAARAAGYFSSLVTLAAVTHDELRGALNYLSRQSVEAIVMIVTQQEALAVVRSEATTIPLIVVEGELSGRGLSVGVDQMEGARLATQHLVDLGHRDIVHVSGPLTWTEARARRAGYVEVMRAARLPVRADLEGDWSPARG
ncbi:MAG TPA: LacI family DNA-binding transcriptional regulator, partial [Mycobacterium sp.]